MPRALVAAGAVFYLFLAGGLSALCESDDPVNFSTDFRGKLNQDLNDYGLLVLDAGVPECAEKARDRLLAKVANTLARTDHLDERSQWVGPYGGWLEGAQVALIFAAAMEIHGQGALTSELDAELQRVRDSYAFVLDPTCGFMGDRWKNFNTCMDDYSVAASAYGWISGYEYRRQRPASEWSAWTTNLIRASLDPGQLCLHNPDPLAGPPTPCNATLGDVARRDAELISLNHGQQSIPYGFGLMTSIAAAYQGMRYSDFIYRLDVREERTAVHLLDEAQRKTHLTGDAFKNDCARNFRQGPGGWEYDANADCGETRIFGYLPKMYALNAFYSRHVSAPLNMLPVEGVVQRVYEFTEFDPSLFSRNYLAFQNAGRLVTYGHLAYQWFLTPPLMPERGKPLDDVDPLGQLEEIDASGRAMGWVCDADAPGVPIQVDFSTDPDGDDEARITTVLTEKAPADAAALAQCGGEVQRFEVQLPDWTKDRPVYARAKDATGRGKTLLPPSCSKPMASGCLWVDLPRPFPPSRR